MRSLSTLNWTHLSFLPKQNQLLFNVRKNIEQIKMHIKF